MSCVINVGEFPTDLGCLGVSGYIGTIFRKEKYLGGETHLTQMPTVEVDLMIFEKTHEAEFLKWWEEDLQYGSMPFNVEMKFFGAMHMLTFFMVSNLKEVLENGYSNNPIKLELVYEPTMLETIVYSYELECDTTIECDQVLICN